MITVNKMAEKMFLGIDFGKRRVGLALGSTFAYGAGIAEAGEDAFRKIAELCQGNDVSMIVVGMPIRSQGEDGTIASEIKAFTEKIHQISGLPIVFEPEQFSSTEAHRILAESGGKPEARIDEVAAILILEQFLNRLKEVGLNNIKADIS